MSWARKLGSGTHAEALRSKYQKKSKTPAYTGSAHGCLFHWLFPQEEDCLISESCSATDRSGRTQFLDRPQRSDTREPTPPTGNCNSPLGNWTALNWPAV